MDVADNAMLKMCAVSPALRQVYNAHPNVPATPIDVSTFRSSDDASFGTPAPSKHKDNVEVFNLRLQYLES
jgi:hypothetical protein